MSDSAVLDVCDPCCALNRSLARPLSPGLSTISEAKRDKDAGLADGPCAYENDPGLLPITSAVVGTFDHTEAERAV